MPPKGMVWSYQHVFNKLRQRKPVPWEPTVARLSGINNPPPKSILNQAKHHRQSTHVIMPSDTEKLKELQNYTYRYYGKPLTFRKLRKRKSPKRKSPKRKSPNRKSCKR